MWDFRLPPWCSWGLHYFGCYTAYVCSWLLTFQENVLMSVTNYLCALYNIPEETLMLYTGSWHIHVIDNVSCIFRPLNAFEKNMKSFNIVDCPNNREVIVKERAVDKITRTFAFDRVFGPNSRQVSMSVFIYSFWYVFDTLFIASSWSLLLLLLLLLLLNVIYIDFSVCVISCRKLGSKTLGVAFNSITFILNLMKLISWLETWQHLDFDTHAHSIQWYHKPTLFS
jgi:hypothetical protein